MFLFAVPARNDLKGECQGTKRPFEIFSDSGLNIDMGEIRKLGSGVKGMEHYLACLNETELRGIIELDDVFGQFAETIGKKMMKPVRSKIPEIMGIVNMTPDSFYEGSRYLNSDVESLTSVVRNSDIVDVGGESTRPGALPVPVQVEVERVEKALSFVRESSDVPVSVDTMHPETLRAVLKHGIDYINDVSGFRDTRMIEIARDEGLKCIIMHMRGTAADMMQHTHYSDLIGEVAYFLARQARELLAGGIAPSHILLDPGLGFSKDFRSNVEICGNLQSFKMGFGLLIGHSRKSFVGKIMENMTEDRLAATLSTTLFLYESGVDVIRVHDPLENRYALNAYEFLRKQSRSP